MHNFKSSLRAGAAGEARIHAMFPAWTRTDGKKEDFRTAEGKKVEIKTESRTTTQTKNLALELWSSTDRPGAIERAYNDGIDFIIYLFADDKLFVYKPLELLNFMAKTAGNYRTVKIPNKTYESTVVLIPREDVAHLEVEL